MTVIALTITDVGYGAWFKAQKQGIKLNVTDFVVTDFTVPYTPSPSQTALVGPVVYRGPIEMTRITDRNDRVFRLLIPDTTPPASLYEVALYCFDGTTRVLFAVGIFDPLYVKNTEFQLRVYAYLKAPDQNLSVEFDINEIPIVPQVDTFNQLPLPNISGCNTFVVKQGHCKAPVQTPVLVTKYKGDRWAVVNGSLVTTSKVISTDLAGTSFTIELGPKLAADLSLDAYDWAMVSVIDGPGKYQTRNLSYADKLFQVTPAFDVLPDNTSVVELWAGPGCCGGT